jgi:hypothetical protein
MPEREPGREPWVDPSQMREPEPDWAKEIHAHRRARAERLRKVFDGFDGRFPEKSSPPEPPVGEGR